MCIRDRNKFYFEQEDGELMPPLGSKMVGIKLKKGQAVRLESPGGGGYGKPLSRSIERVVEDVRLGYVTPNAAKSEYSVVLDREGKIDLLATQEKRNINSKTEVVS